ncbi:hypothetical protein [Kribbella sp. NPDC055071]
MPKTADKDQDGQYDKITGTDIPSLTQAMQTLLSFAQGEQPTVKLLAVGQEMWPKAADRLEKAADDFVTAAQQARAGWNGKDADGFSSAVSSSVKSMDESAKQIRTPVGALKETQKVAEQTIKTVEDQAKAFNAKLQELAKKVWPPGTTQEQIQKEAVAALLPYVKAAGQALTALGKSYKAAGTAVKMAAEGHKWVGPKDSVSAATTPRGGSKQPTGGGTQGGQGQQGSQQSGQQSEQQGGQQAGGQQAGGEQSGGGQAGGGQAGSEGGGESGGDQSGEQGGDQGGVQLPGGAEQGGSSLAGGAVTLPQPLPQNVPLPTTGGVTLPPPAASVPLPPGLIGIKPVVPGTIGSTAGGVGITGIGGGVGGIGGGGKATIGGSVIRPGGVGKTGLPDLERQIAQAARTMGTSLSASGQAPTLPSSAPGAAGAAPTGTGGTPMTPMGGGLAGAGGGAGAGGNEGSPRSRHRLPRGTIRAPQADERPIGQAPGVPSGLKGRSSKPDRDDGFVMPLPMATRRPTKQRDQAKSLELLDEDLWNVDDGKHPGHPSN